MAEDELHPNEAISAVVDEEDDDYEDLYNDVNVGENFQQQSMIVNNEDVTVGAVNDNNNQVKNNDPGPKPEPEPEPEPDPDPDPGDRVNEARNVEPLPLKIELGKEITNIAKLEEKGTMNNGNNNSISLPIQGNVGNIGSVGNGGGFAKQVGSVNGTTLFVGDLHWWTTDAEIEAEVCKYGPVKEVRFFDEKASGKSKGYCQVEFYDPSATTACKEGMNGFVFNGRPCVVAFASPFTVKRMGEAQVNRTQPAVQSSLGPPARAGGRGDSGGNRLTGGNGNYQGGGDNNNNNNRGYGRGNWGRNNGQGMGNRGPMGPRHRPGGMFGRGNMGNNGFGQGFGAGLATQAMMGQGFDPSFGAPMGRMGGYGGFPGGPTPPFQGMMSSFPPVGGVGMPGVAPHVNPAFFGRGMSMNGMGMMNPSGLDSMGMWSDPNMGGWGNEEHGGRVAESSYVEEAVSDHQYVDVSHDRAGRPSATKEKDREWSESSDVRYQDEREADYSRPMIRENERGSDRDREREHDRGRERSRERSRDHDRERDHHRDDRDRYVDHHRYKEREPDYDGGYDDGSERGRSSRTYSKCRPSQEEEQRVRPRDAEYTKRRRLTSE